MLKPSKSWSEKSKDLIESLKFERLLLQCEVNMWKVLCWDEDHNMLIFLCWDYIWIVLIGSIPRILMRKILDSYHSICLFKRIPHVRQ